MFESGNFNQPDFELQTEKNEKIGSPIITILSPQEMNTPIKVEVPLDLYSGKNIHNVKPFFMASGNHMHIIKT